MYTFHMTKWAKTCGTVQAATSSFDYFANLLMAKFSERSDFGTKTVEMVDGAEVTITRRTPEQILNVIKYATMEVFTCTECFIQKYRRSVLDYAIFHRARGKHKTHEQYIHLVACHCLTHSNFHAPNVDYPLVDFCIDEQVFRPDALTGMVAVPESAVQEEE
ncbi:hypothetical protein GPECTOR_147g19 [Gonium pectorale]|uniref:Uncharacterized protein n=1 Tax=Gonium pectorale TaxID=33097 RepID=A0A150FZ00_GONPE|nr:hypothetical protein GPECTOR_147g19 [Gonium pectorale]|eukprot:KXZ42435.1 hypothetical protein GPECTOR_147g19 [Gonium pectorale]